MISFWHLTAVCCVPRLNLERRQREQEIFRQVANDTSRLPLQSTQAPLPGRWEMRNMQLAGKGS